MRCGAPGAVQVADRFHLLRNLGDALASALDRHHRDLRAAAASVREADTAQTAPAASPAPATKAQGPDRHALRRARFNEALALRGQGWPVRRIARALGVDRKTVRDWLRSGEFPSWRHRPRGSSVDRHAEHLNRRWDEGCRNAVQLWREIQDQGFRGRSRTVQRWVHGRRSADPGADAAGVSRAAPWPTPSKHRAAWLVVADPERLDAAEQRFVDALLARSPDVAGLVSLARRFSTMVRQQQAEMLDGWLAAAKGSALTGFADGIRRDSDAVRAALKLPWSTGPVEGQISRLKTIKRAMCGRAGFELLRQRVLLAA